MLISVGLELNNEGRALAWALDFPGCFADGLDGPEAILALARNLVNYERWVNQHSGSDQLRLGDFDIRIVDTWEVFTINDRYEREEGAYAVNAWFLNDWKPLEPGEVDRGVELLRWSREDLLKIAEGISGEQMEQTYPGERWSIRGILQHIGSAEWWYLDRFGLAGCQRNALPKDPFQRLQSVRERLLAVLPDLAGKELVVGKEGEFWSPRKLLRRCLWHEINHRFHIMQLL